MTGYVCGSLAADDLVYFEPWYQGDGPDWPWLARFAHHGTARVFVIRDQQPRGVAWWQVMDTEAELIDIRIDPGMRRQQLGQQLLSHSLAALAVSGVRCCYLEVRQSNAAALALYRRFGFQETGRRRDYYPSAAGREDAILMQCELPGEASLS